jgi:CHAT domain-containing protein
VRSRLLAAEFTLLSACRTAELTDGSIADEALHLTAAVEYCGFRSVGTMWAMADTDGRGLAEQHVDVLWQRPNNASPLAREVGEGASGCGTVSEERETSKSGALGKLCIQD